MNEIAVQNGVEKDSDFMEVCDLFFRLQSHKAKRYGDSWCKHGEAISVFGNTSRKYDRIQNIVVDFATKGVPLPPHDSDESLAETVGDLAIYCILWMTHIKKNRPEEYSSWKSKIDSISYNPTEYMPKSFVTEAVSAMRVLVGSALKEGISAETARRYIKEMFIKNVV